MPRETAFDMSELQHAAELVRRVLPPTPQRARFLEVLGGRTPALA